MKALYQGLMRITRAVVRQAEAGLPRLRGRREATQLSATVDLVRQVVAQTRARVLRGDTHYPGKVVSLFVIGRDCAPRTFFPGNSWPRPHPAVPPCAE